MEFRSSILSLCEEKQTDVIAKAVLLRLSNVNDLVAAECRYHGWCQRNFTRRVKPTIRKPGRPVSDSKYSSAFAKLCEHIDTNDMQCQYKLSQLEGILSKFSADSIQNIGRAKLREDIKRKYKDNVKITTHRNVVTFNFYASDRFSKFERADILDKAAEILVNDARQKVYDCDLYPKLKLEPKEELFPHTLNLFMNALATKCHKSTSNTTLERKLFAISELILNFIRERSYVSPLLTNLGLHLHRKFGSRFEGLILNSVK